MPIEPLIEKKQPLSLLIQGAPGTGKTTFCCQLAEYLPRKTLIIDYDGKLGAQANLTPAQRAKIDVWTPADSPQAFSVINTKVLPKEPGSYVDFITAINSIPSDPFPYDFVALDTLTNLSEDLETFMRKMTGFTQGAKGDASYAFWDNVGSNLIGCIKGLKKVPCMTAVCVHTQHEKDEITGVILTTPTVRSKKRYILGKEFAEAYVFQGSNGKAFTALVEGNQRYVARTGLPISKPISTLEEIQKAILSKVGEG